MGLIKKNEQRLVTPFLRIDAYVGADAASFCSVIFLLVCVFNVCTLTPDQTFFDIGISTRSLDGDSGDLMSVFTWQ
jgi:hypothetical protein